MSNQTATSSSPRVTARVEGFYSSAALLAGDCEVLVRLNPGPHWPPGPRLATKFRRVREEHR